MTDPKPKPETINVDEGIEGSSDFEWFPDFMG